VIGNYTILDNIKTQVVISVRTLMERVYQPLNPGCPLLHKITR